MSYIIDINVPLHIEADSDADALLIAEHISRVLAQTVTYPHNAEVFDAPHITVTHTAPYEAPTRVYDSDEPGGPDIADADPDDCADCADERAAQIAVWESYHA